MKTWQFWVIVLVFVLVVIPFLYFAVVAKNVAKVASSTDIKSLNGDGTPYIYDSKGTQFINPSHYTK